MSQINNTPPIATRQNSLKQLLMQKGWQELIPPVNGMTYVRDGEALNSKGEPVEYNFGPAQSGEVYEGEAEGKKPRSQKSGVDAPGSKAATNAEVNASAEAERIISKAQSTADAITRDAEHEAAKIVADARTEAAAIISKAHAAADKAEPDTKDTVTQESDGKAGAAEADTDSASARGDGDRSAAGTDNPGDGDEGQQPRSRKTKSASDNAGAAKNGQAGKK